MSEQSAIHGTRRSFNDGDWEARTVVDAGPSVDAGPFKEIGLVIEHATPDGKTIVTLPLTPPRARALIQLPHVILEEVGESSGVWLTGEQPDGSCVRDGESRVLGFRPSKKSP